MKKHRQSNTRLYKIWGDAKNRCTNKNNSAYKHYGGRGISFLNEWNDFTTFYNWAISNGYNDNLTLDRIDVNGNYEPDNCRWITQKEQCNNTRKNRIIEYNLQTHTLSEWSELYNIPYKTLHKRLKDGWSFEKSILTPLNTTHITNTRKVYCNEINIIFNSVIEAKQYCKEKFGKSGNISRSAESTYLKSCGFKWYYIQ